MTDGSATSPAIDDPTFAGLLEMTGGDLEFLDELVDTYLADGEAQVAALRAASDGGTLEDLVRPAHSLKSSSLNIGALRLGELCRSLEADARGGSVDDPAARVELIDVAFSDASAALLEERERRTSG